MRIFLIYKKTHMYIERMHIQENEYKNDTLKKDWIFYYPIFFSILLQRTGTCL